MSKPDYDIEKYLRGEMSPEEMHALERKALDDPFLHDALEGASIVNSKDFSQDIAELRERKKNGKVVSLWTWTARIAAGLVLIVIAGVGVVYFIGSANESKLADTSLMNARDSLEVSSNADVKDSANSLRNKNVPESSASTQQAKAKTHMPAVAKDNNLASADSEINASPETEQLHEDLVIAEPNLSATSPNSGYFNYSAPKRIVNGLVIDSEDGKGLPGVNVMIKGSNVGTVTDEEGRYQLPIDSLADGLLFSFIGFESKEVVPGNATELNVTLAPDISQLSEVVVVGYGADKAPEDAPTMEFAYPKGGRRAFKQYLEQNLKYPEQALNNKVEGKVTVQFTIESNGKMGDFQVLKGIGFGCDEEVIRLIKEGPQWYATKRNEEPVRDKVKVRMRFSLPKKK